MKVIPGERDIMDNTTPCFDAEIRYDKINLRAGTSGFGNRKAFYCGGRYCTARRQPGG